MTPFEARGWAKDTKFKVIAKTGYLGFEVGTVVWLDRDDGTSRPRFTDGRETGYCTIDEEIEVYHSKDTIFNLRLTGEELVYLAVLLDNPGFPPTAAKLDNSVYCKVEDILLDFADVKTWIWDKLESIDDVINKVFPPQESPEQKQYKELLAQREALDAQLAQLSQKLNLEEKIGGEGMNLKHCRFDLDRCSPSGVEFCEDGLNIDCGEVLEFISQQELLQKSPEEIIQMLKEGLK